jgi:hypothetical protein
MDSKEFVVNVVGTSGVDEISFIYAVTATV